MKFEMSQISAKLPPRHKISLKSIRNLNCNIGGSNSSVDEGSGLLVYDALWYDEWLPMFSERTVVSFSLGSSSPKRILGLLHPEDGVTRSCGMSVTAQPPTQCNILKTCSFRPIICCLLPRLEFHHIYIYIYVCVQGVPGGICQTSGECSLC